MPEIPEILPKKRETPIIVNKRVILENFPQNRAEFPVFPGMNKGIKFKNSNN
jgi:hypothetical protein